MGNENGEVFRVGERFGVWVLGKGWVIYIGIMGLGFGPNSSDATDRLQVAVGLNNRVWV